LTKPGHSAAGVDLWVVTGDALQVSTDHEGVGLVGRTSLQGVRNLEISYILSAVEVGIENRQQN
jgi:hypothetical protein